MKNFNYFMCSPARFVDVFVSTSALLHQVYLHNPEKSLKIPPEAVNQERTDNKYQSKKNKATNNDLQNTTHKTEQHDQKLM
jgi:hypothetical protein